MDFSGLIIAYLPWLLSALTVWSMYMAGDRSRTAWVIGIVNQALWLLWIVVTGTWGLLLATIVLTAVFVRNLINWSKVTPVYKNPPTVVVLLVPVIGRGLLVVKRAIAPIGGIALPGGYQVEGETWQEAAARELREETGIEAVGGLRVVDVVTVGNGKANLLFVESDPVVIPEDHVFTHDAETLSVDVVDGPVESCFPTHGDRIAAFFASRDPGAFPGPLPEAARAA